MATSGPKSPAQGLGRHSCLPDPVLQKKSVPLRWPSPSVLPCSFLAGPGKGLGTA
jgi:hypothetical protein